MTIAGVAVFLATGLTIGWFANEHRHSELARAADIIIIDSMLADRPTYQELSEGPVGVEACAGEALRVANGTRRTIGLATTPEESDARVELGIVQPGGVLAFDVGNQTRAYYLSNTEGTLLSRYDVTQCEDGA